MIALIGLCAFATVALLTIALGQQLSLRPVQLRGRLETIAAATPGPASGAHGRRLLRIQNYSRLPWFQRLLQRTPRAEQIGDSLDRAGIQMRVGTYVGLSLAMGLLLAFAVLLWLPESTIGLLFALAAFLAGLYVPRWFVKRRIRRRRAQIEAILPDALDMISRSLRAGAGLMIAIENMLEQIEGPLAVEFGRFHQEIAAGLPVEAAFHELDRRVGSKDLHIVVTAILIQREVGGNLTEILGNIAAMMRERVRMRGEVKALTSRQIFSTYGMAILPPLLVVSLILVARPLIQPLFDHQGGWIVLGIATAFEVCGFLIVKRIAASPIEV